MHKFTLGTAQLGMDYGINNKTGKPKTSESLSILEYAYNHNIRSFDTALAYGNSESILGEWFNEKKNRNIILTSKVPSLKKHNIKKIQIEGEIRRFLEITLNNLNKKELNYYLIHDFNDIRCYGEKIFIALDKLKSEGLIGKYGCSIYNIDELEYISEYNIEAIQIPGSIFNQNILESKMLSKLKKNGTKIFVRSVFVQGLIFMKDNEVPENLSGITGYLKKLREMVEEKGITITEAAINYVRNHPNTDSIVFGVDSILQLKELLDININNELNPADINREFSEIPLELIDPRYWG